MFDLAWDRWFECVINDNSPAQVTSSSFIKKCDIEHFNRGLSKISLLEFSPRLLIVARFNPANNYFFKVNNRNTRKKPCHWRRSGVCIVNFKHLLHLF